MPQHVRHSGKSRTLNHRGILGSKADDRDEERELNQISYVEQQIRCTYSALYSVPDIQTGFLAYASDRCKF